MFRILFLLLLVTSVYGQWVSIGPEGGWVDRVVFHPAAPETMYAGGDTYGSFYRSTDGGNSWERDKDFGDLNVWELVVDPRPPYTIYAGNIMDDSVGILKSTDGGRSWSKILDVPDIAAIALHPQDQNIIYAGAGYWPDYQEPPHGDGVWKTTNGGISWSHVGLDTFNVQTVIINPKAPDTVYAGVFGAYAGVYMSPDAGSSWTLTGLAGKDIWRLAISPDADNELYAAAWDSVYKSTDYGTSWTALPIPIDSLFGFFFAMAIAPSNNNIIYVGSITGNGIYKSTDRGNTWVAVNTGLPAKRVWTLSVHPTNSDIVFQGQMGQGIWRTTNGGGVWEETNTGMKCHYCFEVLVDPNSRLFAGFYNESGNNMASVKRWSSTGGWQELGSLNDESAMTIAIDPSNRLNIYAATKYEWSNGGFFYRSSDEGANWTKAGNGIPDSLRVEAIGIHPDSGDIIFAGTAQGFGYWGGDGIYKSTDRGSNFSHSGLDSLTITRIVIDPNKPRTVYVATVDNVYKSTDGGANWQPTGLTGLAALSLAINPINPNILFAGTYFAGLYRTTDGGTNWTNIGFYGRSVTAIAVNPAHPDTVYVGGSESIQPGWGVYMSTDGGDNWTDFSDGMINLQVSSIAIDSADPGIIYASTLGYGIYRRDLGIGVEEKTMRDLNGYHIKTVFTGPLRLPKGKKCRVFDISGRQIEPNRIRPGVYFIEIDGRVSQKVVKIR